MDSAGHKSPAPGAAPGVTPAGRAFRIAVASLLVLGVEWRFADPAVVSADPELWMTPWAMLILSLPLALGVWAFEVSAPGGGGMKADALWSVLAGTLSYVALSLLL